MTPEVLPEVLPVEQERGTPDLFAVTQASFNTPKTSDTGTHLRSPLMIGNPGEAGIALLNKRGYMNFAVGNFTGALVKFPFNSVLLSIYVSILTPFNGVTPTLNFGKTAAGAEFGTADLSLSARTIAIPVTALVSPTYSLFMSATGLGASTAGECLITMVYSGAPLKTWQ